MENIMTNTRPLEDAERQLFNLVHDISNISRIFKATDPEVARIISRAYSKCSAFDTPLKILMRETAI